MDPIKGALSDQRMLDSSVIFPGPRNLFMACCDI